MAKVDGSRNPADVQTKHVSRELAEKHMRAISCEYREGRAVAAAQLHSLRRQRRQVRHLLRVTLGRAETQIPSRTVSLRPKQHIESKTRELEASVKIELEAEATLLALRTQQESAIAASWSLSPRGSQC